MDKNLRAQVFETYNRYLNAFNEADMETINDCISYFTFHSGFIHV